MIDQNLRERSDVCKRSDVCIIGLGLMGGSLAKALKGHARQLIGVDRHAATRQAALADGTVDWVTGDVAVGLKQADVVILATPVHAILEFLRQLPLLKPEGCLLLDLGSTKEEICAAMSALPSTFSAIGGHPMCGKETAGYHAATADLFQGQTFILSRTDRTDQRVEELALAVINQIGARSMFLPAREHDQLVAVASHLPYLISATLMHHASSMQDARVWPVSASGFRDSTRLAGSDPRMMRDILLTNREAVLAQLVQYASELAHLTSLLENEDEAALTAWLEDTRKAYIAYRHAKENPDPK